MEGINAIQSPHTNKTTRIAVAKWGVDKSGDGDKDEEDKSDEDVVHVNIVR